MTGIRNLRVLAVLLPALACTHAVHADGARSGAWWQGAPREERLGYLAGYLDCAVADAGQSSLANVSWYNLEPKVSKQYAAGPEVMTQQVSTVIKGLASVEPSNPLDKGGDRYPGKHGMFAGEYWRQAQPEHRLGFIEGYVDCLRSEAAGGSRYSRPAATYVARLSEWFGIKAGDPGVIRADRAETTIADALRLFRDQ